MMTGIICGFYHGSAKKKLDYESNNCLPNGYFAYPSLLLFLIRLRSKYRKIIAIILNYIYDIFSCLILFFISLDFNEEFNVQIDSLNFTFSLIVCLFFYSSASLSPFIARIGGVSQRLSNF